MPKPKLDAKAVLEDIRAGMDEATLMEKYNLSVKGLHSLLRKLVSAGALEESVIWIGLPLKGGAPSPKNRALSAKEALKDIRAGMSDGDLMRKYKLSSKGLQNLFEQLLEAGLIKESDLEQGKPLAENTVEITERGLSEALYAIKVLTEEKAAPEEEKSSSPAEQPKPEPKPKLDIWDQEAVRASLTAVPTAAAPTPESPQPAVPPPTEQSAAEPAARTAEPQRPPAPSAEPEAEPTKKAEGPVQTVFVRDQDLSLELERDSRTVLIQKPVETTTLSADSDATVPIESLRDTGEHAALLAEQRAAHAPTIIMDVELPDRSHASKQDATEQAQAADEPLGPEPAESDTIPLESAISTVTKVPTPPVQEKPALPEEPVLGDAMAMEQTRPEPAAVAPPPLPRTEPEPPTVPQIKTAPPPEKARPETTPDRPAEPPSKKSQPVTRPSAALRKPQPESRRPVSSGPIPQLDPKVLSRAGLLASALNWVGVVALVLGIIVSATQLYMMFVHGLKFWAVLRYVVLPVAASAGLYLAMRAASEGLRLLVYLSESVERLQDRLESHIHDQD